MNKIFEGPVNQFVTASTEYGINKVAAPVHLQRLKSFFLIVCGVHAMSAFSIVVLYNHPVNAKLNNRWLFDPQAPDEKVLQKMPKKIDTDKGEPLEKLFDRMGRGHLVPIRLNTFGIAAILLKMIKVDQMPAAAIQQEAKHLFEKLCYFNNIT